VEEGDIVEVEAEATEGCGCIDGVEDSGGGASGEEAGGAGSGRGGISMDAGRGGVVGDSDRTMHLGRREGRESRRTHPLPKSRERLGADGVEIELSLEYELEEDLDVVWKGRAWLACCSLSQ